MANRIENAIAGSPHLLLQLEEKLQAEKLAALAQAQTLKVCPAPLTGCGFLEFVLAASSWVGNKSTFTTMAFFNQFDEIRHGADGRCQI